MALPIHLATAHYVPQSEDEMKLKEGHKVMVVQMFQNGWAQICNSKAVTGYVPASLLESSPVSTAKRPDSVQNLPQPVHKKMLARPQKKSAGTPASSTSSVAGERYPVDKKTAKAPWYLGQADKEEVMAFAKDMMANGPVGAFVLRIPERFPGNYGLTVKVAPNTKPQSVMIKCSNQEFVCGPARNATMIGLLSTLAETPNPLPCRLRLDWRPQQKPSHQTKAKAEKPKIPKAETKPVSSVEEARRKKMMQTAPPQATPTGYEASSGGPQPGQKGGYLTIEAMQKLARSAGMMTGEQLARLETDGEGGYVAPAEMRELAADAGYLTSRQMRDMSKGNPIYVQSDQVQALAVGQVATTAGYLTVQQMRDLVQGKQIFVDKSILQRIKAAVKQAAKEEAEALPAVQMRTKKPSSAGGDVQDEEAVLRRRQSISGAASLAYAMMEDTETSAGKSVAPQQEKRSSRRFSFRKSKPTPPVAPEVAPDVDRETRDQVALERLASMDRLAAMEQTLGINTKPTSDGAQFMSEPVIESERFAFQPSSSFQDHEEVKPTVQPPIPSARVTALQLDDGNATSHSSADGALVTAVGLDDTDPSASNATDTDMLQLHRAASMVRRKQDVESSTDMVHLMDAHHGAESTDSITISMATDYGQTSTGSFDQRRSSLVPSPPAATMSVPAPTSTQEQLTKPTPVTSVPVPMLEPTVGAEAEAIDAHVVPSTRSPTSLPVEPARLEVDAHGTADITLLCGAEQVKVVAHSEILNASHSIVLRRVVQGKQSNEFPELSADSVRAALTALYAYHYDPNSDMNPGLIAFADLLECWATCYALSLTRVQEHCLRQMLWGLSIGNCAYYLESAVQLKIYPLEVECQKLLEMQPHAVLRSPGVHHLSDTVMHTLLRSSKLMLTEDEVWCWLLQWGLFNCGVTSTDCMPPSFEPDVKAERLSFAAGDEGVAAFIPEYARPPDLTDAQHDALEQLLLPFIGKLRIVQLSPVYARRYILPLNLLPKDTAREFEAYHNGDLQLPFNHPYLKPRGASTLFEGTTLLSEEQQKQLCDWIPGGDNARFAKIYSSIEMGDSARVFHEKCDGRQPTVVVIQTESRYLFGGVTFSAWQSTPPLSTRFHTPMTTFLFRLMEDGNDSLVDMFPSLADGGIICSRESGPQFGRRDGHGRAALYIADNFTSNSDSYSYLDNGFSTGEDVDPVLSLAGPEHQFRVYAMEVFSLQSTGESTCVI
eukprot:m.340338 g.340338  ORF g.340338 m.340338 type:complete len:1226 (+) comp16102_c0_seq1:158-3835(+)